MHAPALVVVDQLYGVYLDNWTRAAQPKMVQECRAALQSGCPLEDIIRVLDSPTYEGIKADVLMELRK